MKVIFLTLGSRGDVQPYVALGHALVQNGHEVTVCTGKTFKNFVEKYGLNFYEASADLMAMLESDEGKAVFNGSAFNVFKMMDYAKRIITPAYRASMDDFFKASSGADILVYHPKALGACDIADYYGIPAVIMPPVPIMYPVSEFPNLAISASGNFGAYLNRFTYKASNLAERGYMKQINDFRNLVLNMNKRKAGIYNKNVGKFPLKMIYSFSPSLFEDVSSWKGHVDVTGFCYLDITEEKLPKSVEAFLVQGKKPIVISFSSMPLKQPEQFKKVLLAALKATNNRAIVLTGISGLNFDNEDNVLVIDKAPHRLIFPIGKGIIHHGGVGTMAEALLSGVPQLIIPFAVDQPFWANRLYKQGLTLKPMKEKQLTQELLSAAFLEFDQANRKDKARVIQAKISKENGLNKCVRILESLYSGSISN